MLIRWATENDLLAWYTLASEMSEIFQHPNDMGVEFAAKSSGKEAISRYEILTAVDYMSGNNMGFICFSRANNSITWFAVSEKYRGIGVGDRLLKTALRQLDSNKDITVITFPADYSQGTAARTLYRKYGFTEEKQIVSGGLPRSEMKHPADNENHPKSFHYRYPEFIKEALNKEYCPCTIDLDHANTDGDVIFSEQFWACLEYPGQGRLFGKMFVAPQEHYYHFEDMPETEANRFMNEVRRIGRVLRSVTGAVKINYEMHSNSGAHLHIHLFPRYLDDDFPGMAIDVLQREPAPYKSYEEFLWLVKQMRIELNR